MASSFVSQIPVVVYLLQRLAPTSMLDIGKGFGKYGFLAHEYDSESRPRPRRTRPGAWRTRAGS